MDIRLRQISISIFVGCPTPPSLPKMSFAFEFPPHFLGPPAVSMAQSKSLEAKNPKERQYSAVASASTPAAVASNWNPKIHPSQNGGFLLIVKMVPCSYETRNVTLKSLKHFLRVSSGLIVM